jgi:hypothetical protein
MSKLKFANLKGFLYAQEICTVSRVRDVRSVCEIETGGERA